MTAESFEGASHARAVWLNQASTQMHSFWIENLWGSFGVFPKLCKALWLITATEAVEKQIATLSSCNR